MSSVEAPGGEGLLKCCTVASGVTSLGVNGRSPRVRIAAGLPFWAALANPRLIIYLFGDLSVNNLPLVYDLPCWLHSDDKQLEN
jgi:hypothetical protein